jgi:hypothetical protein
MTMKDDLESMYAVAMLHFAQAGSIPDEVIGLFQFI